MLLKINELYHAFYCFSFHNKILYKLKEKDMKFQLNQVHYKRDIDLCRKNNIWNNLFKYISSIFESTSTYIMKMNKWYALFLLKLSLEPCQKGLKCPKKWKDDSTSKTASFKPCIENITRCDFAHCIFSVLEMEPPQGFRDLSKADQHLAVEIDFPQQNLSQPSSRIQKVPNCLTAPPLSWI